MSVTALPLAGLIVSVSLAGAAEVRPVAPATSPVHTRADASADDRGAAYFEFMRGRRLEGEGQTDAALDAYERAAQLDPTSADIQSEIAALHMRQNRAEPALKSARAALKLDPDDPEAHWVVGTVYAALLEAETEEGGRTPREARPPRPPDVTADAAIAHLEQARPARGYDYGLHLTLGRLYLQKEEWAKAIAVIDYVVEREPGALEAAYMLAQAYDGAGNRAEAMTTLEETVRLEPQFFRALVYLADLYGRQGQWDKAAQTYGRAALENPRNVELRLREVAALTKAGRAAEGRTLLKQLADDSTEPRVLYLLAEAERDAEDYAAAEQTARRLIELAPKQPFGPHALAQAYAAQHKYREVIATLEPVQKELDTRPASERGAYVPLLVTLAFAYQELGQIAPAVATFERVRAIMPNEPSAAVYLGQAYLAANRIDRALDVVQDARKTHPDVLRLMIVEAQAHVRKGDVDRGVAILEDAVKKDPDELQAYLALTGVLVDSKRFERAEQLLADASRRFPKNVAVPFQLGAVFEEQDRPVEAEKAFRQALAMDPLHAPTLNYLGYMLAERGMKLDEAVKMLTQAVQIEPNNGSYLDSLGWAYFKKGQLQKAREYLVRAGEQMPENSVIQEHVGDLLFAMREFDGAIAAWQRSLNGDGQDIDRGAISRKIDGARKK